jgi:hypothetical protein
LSLTVTRVVTWRWKGRQSERRLEREGIEDLSFHVRQSPGHDLEDALRGRVGEEDDLSEEEERSEELLSAR